MTKTEKRELVAAVEALLADVERMQVGAKPDWYGLFGAYDTVGGGVYICWPNLAKHVEALTDALPVHAPKGKGK